MTHDGLLVKLMVMGADESEQMRLSKTTQALRAVVKLHKPEKRSHPEKLYCSVCYEEGAPYEIAEDVHYPCPTIQAIEKEFA